MKKISILFLVTTLTAIHAESPLQSAVLKQGSLEISATALPGPKKKVGLVIVNSGESDVQLAGRVTATSSKKTTAVADCRFTTTAPAKSDSKKKITCDTSGADTLTVTIDKPAP